MYECYKDFISMRNEQLNRMVEEHNRITVQYIHKLESERQLASICNEEYTEEFLSALDNIEASYISHNQ